jgi:hypothetical protein
VRLAMQAITVADADDGVVIVNRTLPSLLQGVFAIAMVGALAYALYEMMPSILDGGGDGTWLPPFDQLSKEWRTAIMLATMAAAFAITFAPLYASVETLLYGKVWTFDTRARRITRNRHDIGSFDDGKEILVEGDFRGETPDLTLAFVKKDGTRIDIADGTLDEAQFDMFLDAAKAIARRAKIPYRKTGIRPWAEPWWSFPEWWDSRS